MVAPLETARPSLINDLTLVRDRSGRPSARNLSSRAPASPGPARTVETLSSFNAMTTDWTQNMRALKAVVIGLGVVIAVGLAVCFTIYGVIRKQLGVGAMPGLFIETLIILPFAVGYLAWLWWSGVSTPMSPDSTSGFLISLSGPLTVLPLLCFAIAARRLTLTTIGMMQFLAPTLNFGVAIYYGEILTPAHILCFTCIWIAISLFIYDAWRRN